ncbi:MAG: TauD/TfdA dioxygenase family protein [Gammaproteobacteria bacterium]
MFEIQPITGVFGAEIHGIDLGMDPDADTLAALRKAFLDYKVLVFPGQLGLKPAHLVALGRHFGELEIHPFHPHLDDHPEVIILRSDKTGAPRENWHSDVSFRETPSLGSILAAVDVPPYGRDTAFADMEAVYGSLSAPMQRMLADLQGVHDWRHVFGEKGRGGYSRQDGGSEGEMPPARHPLVRTHPQTGRKCIYVNPVFTTHIAGMHRDESAAVLRMLYDKINLPEHQLRCRWAPGTVAMWDNRSVQHALVFDRAYPRVMHRVTIIGDRPA